MNDHEEKINSSEISNEQKKENNQNKLNNNKNNFCSNCGAKLNGDEKFCPNCGSVILKDKSNKEKSTKLLENISNRFKQYLDNLKTKRKTRIITIIVLLLVIFIATMSSSSLSTDERNIVTGMEDLKSELKSPDSIKIYEAIKLSNKNNEDEQYYLVKYGATNSYGAEVTDVAVIKNDQYICTETDAKDDTVKYREINFLINSVKLDWVTNGTENSDWKMKEISPDKIKQKLEK